MNDPFTVAAGNFPAKAEIEPLSGLIGQIYDCTLDPSMWEPTLLAIKDLLECEHAFLHLDNLVTRQSMITMSVGIEPHWLSIQPAYAPEVTGILIESLAAGHSIDLPGVASAGMSRAEIEATSYHREWGKPQGLIDYMDLFLLTSPTRLASLGFGRHQLHGNFTARELELGTFLIPHLRRAVTISNALEAVTIEKARMADTLDALTLGVVLASEDSRILHANRTAETMMRNGGPVRDGGGRLHAENAAANAEINAAIRFATQNESEIGKTGLAVRLTHEDAAPVVAHVLPLARGDVRTRLDPTAVAAVFINSAGEDQRRVGAVASTFGLTPAETRVLTRVLSGKNVNEAAHDLGVASSTVRSHLDKIFEKTNVARQADLIKLVARIAPATM